MQLTSQNIHFPKHWGYSPGADYEAFLAQVKRQQFEIQDDLLYSCFLLGAAHAVESDITRNTIEVVSPIALQTLQSIENAHGVVIADRDLRSVLQSPEFSQQYEIELRKFCDIASNATNMACTGRSLAQSGALGSATD